MSKNRKLLFNLLFCALAPIGGQAVIDGVMLRNGDIYSIAVRHVSGEIRASRYRWQTITGSFCRRMPFLRGFPILLETVFNGIQALNNAASLAGDDGPTSPAKLLLSISLALLLASGLFIVGPHMLSFCMQSLNLGGDVGGLSFHVWDGLFKVLIFMSYVWLISLVPDIRHVFEYHGAEHKTVHAWENCIFVGSQEAASMRRLHPRCGTTFVLFVVAISIFLQTLLVPFFLGLIDPGTPASRHIWSILIKLAMIIPVSAIAYEVICLAVGLSGSWLGYVLQWPGLLLQRITTREPGEKELEVAIVALAEALERDEAVSVLAVPYSHI